MAASKPVPNLSVRVPPPRLSAAQVKSPQKSPHVFADVKKFYNVQWIFLLTFVCVFVLLACCLTPFIGFFLCDTVRVEAGWSLFVYLLISFTDFAPPLPIHVLRSYIIPMYLAFLYLYQHPNNGDSAAGWQELRNAAAAPLELGFTAEGLRFAGFCYMGVFTLLRLLGFTFLKSHTLAEGEKPRILISSDGAYPSVHGVATFNTNMVRGLLSKGYPLHIMTASPAFEAKDQHQIAGASCSRVPCIFTHAGPQTPLGLPNPFLFTKILQKSRPHLVHALEPGSAMNIGLLLMCWLINLPVVVSHHTLTMEYRFTASKANPTVSKYLLFFLYRTIMCLADLHVTTTKLMMDPEIHGVIAWTWPHVKLPNGIKPKHWITGSSEQFDIKHRDDDMRDELSNGNPDAHLIVHVGRFSYEKSIMFLVPVIIKLCEKYGDKVQFALVGWGPLLKPFCDAIIEAGHGDRIKAMNTLTGKRLYQAYASSDIFFSPSCSETYPIVFLEAMRSGLCCVAPNGPRAGGSQHTFIPEQHGFQYPRDDVDKAVEACEKCIVAGTSMQQACIERGRWHSWERTLNQMYDFYDVVMRARGVLKDGKDEGTFPGEEMPVDL
eukprot:INCI4388.1.p1 GENE.INCI4388.1~~INCI4388.1.p1  ORF type:complete len:604 (+),score=75.90 INCI4388.1:110-1921(+)